MAARWRENSVLIFMTKKQTPIQETAAAIAAAENQAAAKRAELLALQHAENIRREPLARLLQKRERLNERITVNTARQAAHKADALAFDEMAAAYFAGGDDAAMRMYHIFDTSNPYHIGMYQHAARAVELIGVCLEKAKAELKQTESEALALATKLDLAEMLPATMRK